MALWAVVGLAWRAGNASLAEAGGCLDMRRS
jgi:hypothetical protein